MMRDGMPVRTFRIHNRISERPQILGISWNPWWSLFSTVKLARGRNHVCHFEPLSQTSSSAYSVPIESLIYARDSSFLSRYTSTLDGFRRFLSGHLFPTPMPGSGIRMCGWNGRVSWQPFSGHGGRSSERPGFHLLETNWPHSVDGRNLAPVGIGNNQKTF